jgi:ATP-dependent DNA ligase
MPPVEPMLAKAVHAVDEVPAKVGPVFYEPKWDGFRCIVFRDGDEVELGSRNDRPLTRYFPELVAPLRAALPDRCVIDGEVVIVNDNGIDFDALQLRLHPAKSRVDMLAASSPASFVAFDLLAVGDRDVSGEPFHVRRDLLCEVVREQPQVYVTPITDDRECAEEWFERFEGAGFDGVMAKPVDLPYSPGKRVMWKIKHERTADCVVAGFRVHKDGKGVGSLLLGLYDDDGSLHHVGVAASFSVTRRRELLDEIAPLRKDALVDHPWKEWADAVAHETTRMPGGFSRWNTGKDLSWEPLRAERVVEVQYEHLQGGRFRHGARMVRWRDDRDPASCTYSQLEVTPPQELKEIFSR